MKKGKKPLLENYNRLFSENLGQDEATIDKLISRQKVEVDFSKAANGKPENFIYAIFQKIKSSGKESTFERKWLEFETDSSQIETGYNGLSSYSTGFPVRDLINKSPQEVSNYKVTVHGVERDGESVDAGDMLLGDLDYIWDIQL